MCVLPCHVTDFQTRPSTRGRNWYETSLRTGRNETLLTETLFCDTDLEKKKLRHLTQSLATLSTFNFLQHNPFPL